jgi:hypothetical protein
MRDGKYLYAVVDMSDTADMQLDFKGIEEENVYFTVSREVAAVVSDFPKKNIRPERRHLAAHQNVLKRLMETTTPLPMAFGIIADSSAAVKKIMSLNRKPFLTNLSRVKNNMEMGLRVSYDAPNIFEYFVKTHEELRILRDRFFGTKVIPDQDQKIELGRTFDRLLNEDREIFTGQVTEILSNYCSEIKEIRCTGERDIMKLACLVKRGKLSEFEQGVIDAAKLFDNNFSFNFNGPWAPHNFVDISLKM